MKQRILILLVIIFSLTFSASTFAKPEMQLASGDIYRLPVFETSDVHGYIAEKGDDGYHYLLAYISDKVKDVRGYGDSYRKDLALLLDGGDIYQGNTMSNLLNGESLSAAYETMDYDAVTLGNHEFDWGVENTVNNDGTMMDSNNEEFEMVNDIPVVVSNLYQNDEKVDWTENGYIILNKKARNASGDEVEVKIGVIGFAENYAKEIMTSQFAGKGYSIKEDFSIPNTIAKKLEDNGDVDATILLCHQDAEEVIEKMKKAGMVEDSAIDVVLGGHSHMNKISEADVEIPYMEPASYGKAYNYCEFVFEIDTNGKVIFKEVGNMENKAVVLDKTLNIAENDDDLDGNMIALTDKVINSVRSVLETKVGYIEHNASTKEFIEGSGTFSTIGCNWASSIYQRATDADVAFVNSTGVRYDFILPEGADKLDVTLGDIYTTYPFNNKIYKFKITYEDLLEVLSFGVKDYYRSFFSSIVGIDCYYTEDGINALVKDGILIYQDGEWKDDWKDKTLTLATNEYVATTDKVFTDGLHNPLVAWCDETGENYKLVDNTKIDSACAIEILTKEAQENDGLLTIDNKAHYIEGKYVEPIDIDFFCIICDPIIENYLVGEEFDYEGLTIYVEDVDGNEYEIESDFELYGFELVNDFDNQIEGRQEVNIEISYGDETDYSFLYVWVVSENHNYPVRISIIDIPNSWEELENEDYTGLKFCIEYEDDSYKIIDYNENDFDIIYEGNAFDVFYEDPELPNYTNFVHTSMKKNDYRYYANDNDTVIYTISTDYTLEHQTLYDINKDYPTQYDLRDKINIDVDNQENFGLCWDFAITKALETTYNLKYNTHINLSEIYMDYMSSKDINGKRYIHDAGIEAEYYNEAIRNGIPLEEELEYRDYDESEYDTIINSKKAVLPIGAVLISTRTAELQKNNEIVKKMVKEHIMNYGGVAYGIAFNYDVIGDGTDRYFMSILSNDNQEHQVTIIGWDDTIPKESFKKTFKMRDGSYKEVEPQHDGAWIALNSWGTDYHNNGVLYISYETYSKSFFGFRDVVPYYDRNEYTYVENEYHNIENENIAYGTKKYFYQEFNVSGDNEYITDIAIASLQKGKVYYIDNYEDIKTVDFNNKKEIGDFSIDQLYYRYRNNLTFNALIKPHFVFDEPIKINGDKFAIIVEVDGSYVPTVWYNQGDEIKTYYTDNVISNDLKEYAGNMPFYVYTINKEETEINTCTIAFDANGGTGTMSGDSVEKGFEYTLPACTYTAPSGMRFDKWDKGNVGDKITINEDTVLTAEWKKKSSGGSLPSSSGKKKENIVKETIWSNVDDWAESEMMKAFEKGLIPETLTNKDFTNQIERADFCAVAVKLYEALTGNKADKVVNNPFTDINDDYVLKAYALGITKGVSETEFGNGTITREQMATMIDRAIIKARVDTKVDLETAPKFADDNEMHDWGRASVYYMVSKEIIKGVGDNRFNPLGEAKVEEALAIALRCVEVFAK